MLQDSAPATPERLLDAADLLVSSRGLEGLSLDAIAQAADVSRATAYRYYPGLDRLMVRLAIRRGEGLIEDLRGRMARERTVLAKLEVAFVRVVADVPQDPVMAAVYDPRSGFVHDDDVSAVSNALLAPVLTDGQAAGEVRTDIDVPEMIMWLGEQVSSLMSRGPLTDDEVRSHVRRFVGPVLRPQTLDVDAHVPALRARMTKAAALAEEIRALLG
jgi:AcrR family transcriptional regulator